MSKWKKAKRIAATAMRKVSHAPEVSPNRARTQSRKMSIPEISNHFNHIKTKIVKLIIKREEVFWVSCRALMKIHRCKK
jgi:hypothetical protein